MRILLIREAENAWAAQWLEHDLVGQGSTQDEALVSLEKTILAAIRVAQEKGENPFANYGPAPQALWERFWEKRPAATVH